MAFNVQNFRSSLSLDGARPNLFEVTMSTGDLGIGGDIGEEMTFKCRAAQLPEDNMGVIPVNYFGREIKVAGNRTFPEWTVTIINDEDFFIRDRMERWLAGINSHEGNKRSKRFENNIDYTAEAYVTQFGKSGDAIQRYTLVGCFPINVSAIDLDWGSNDQIEEFTVTFAYQWWANRNARQ